LAQNFYKVIEKWQLICMMKRAGGRGNYQRSGPMASQEIFILLIS